jgi:hypothetical protein
MSRQPPGKAVHHPVFARVYARDSPGMEPGVVDRRRALLAGLSGRVIEVGAGNGLNFRHYPRFDAGVASLVLCSVRPWLVISAGLSQAWRLLGGSTPPHLNAAGLRAWSQPGWIKAGMEFRLESVPAGTRLSAETRVLATDPRTRRAFAAYWFLIRPWSGAIRREQLRIVAQRAESPRDAG